MNLTTLEIILKSVCKKSLPGGGLQGQLPHADQAWMGLEAAVSDPAEGQRTLGADAAQAPWLPAPSVFAGTSGEGGTDGGKASREPQCCFPVIPSTFSWEAMQPRLAYLLLLLTVSPEHPSPPQRSETCQRRQTSPHTFLLP